MPPAKRTAHEDPQSLKEKLHSLQAAHSSPNPNGRGRRNGNHGVNAVNGSTLKDVMSSNGDNASINSAANEHTSGISWGTQDAAVLQGYRRAYHLDTPSAFKNPLSHVILSQGIGRLSPTMAQKKDRRRVKKEQLALAVRKNFNAQAATETSCIVDWIYTVKNQDKEFRVRFAPLRK